MNSQPQNSKEQLLSIFKEIKGTRTPEWIPRESKQLNKMVKSMQGTKVEFNKYIDILKKVSDCNTGN